MRDDKRSLSPLPHKLDFVKLRRTKGTANNTNPNPNNINTSTGRSNVSSSRKRAPSLNARSTSTPSRSASKTRVHKNNITDVVNDVAASITYHRHWSQVILGSTSGLLFAMSIGLMYSMYMLCRPYGDSISFGILLSVILHPKTREHSYNSRAAREDCVRQMRSVQQMWSERSTLFGVIGSLISLKYFFSYALLQAAIYLGLNKLLVRSWWAGKRNKGVEKQNTKEGKFFLVTTPRGRMLLRLIATCVLSFLAHSLIGFSFFILMHLVLFVIFALTIVFISEDHFVELMWRLWRIT
ncbi:hypothetical protein LSM04_001318 [Trypanosoma melophagium]|nr:hypothetical protein LSM04_001318 [Trypanosoma melophagium]